MNENPFVNNKIIIVEPQCYADEHSDVNAALLAVIRLAFPMKIIFFLAEINHLNLVKRIVLSHNINLIEYQSIEIPNRYFSEARRISAEWRLTKEVIQKAKDLKVNKIIFASVTSVGLLCLKFLIRNYLSIDVLVIPHSILESITEKPSLRKPWNLIFWFRYSLLIGNIPQLRYLLYGESKAAELCKFLPQIQPYVRSINLPYFFKEKTEKSTTTSTLIIFGYFGDLYNKKSTDDFSRLAIDVHQRTIKGKSQFILIGYIGNPAMRTKTYSELIIPSIDRPLIREKYAEYANTIDYVIFCFKPKSYILTVSSSFYDSLAYVKPIIALKTHFFEYYFNKMGDIGYLCDDYDEMSALIVNLIHNKPIKRYSEQCNNIIAGRKLLDVEYLSTKMKNILADFRPV